ncbi:MAG: TRAP transporter large permease subunit [Aquamicrobium sp.]|nr:TRAP transporter large permease subunit [Aquamicrobium sp.]
MARSLERGLAAACGLTLLAMLALVLVTVFQRYLLSSGFLGAEEASGWLLLLLVCLGFPLVAGHTSALRVDFFAPSPAFESVRQVLSETIVLLASLVLVSAGWQAALQLGGTSPLLGFAEWIRPAGLAASGAVAIILRCLQLLHRGKLRRLIISAALALLGWEAVTSGLTLAIMPPSLAALFVILAGILVAAPLPHIFILAGFVAIAFGSPLTEPALAAQILSGAGRSLLLAIPFFLLAGALLVVSRMADGLVRFAAALVGGRRAGLGQTVLLTSLTFSGASGSSIANAAFSAKTFFRPMVEQDYRPERASAIIAATAVLDNIVPPSIAFFILAAATNLPVGPLLTGGLVAGVMLAVALAGAIHLSSKPQESTPNDERGSIWLLAARALPFFGLGLIVVVGIRFGIVTPTEAAALAAAYTLAAALASKTGWRGIMSAFRQAGVETSGIILLIGAATPLAFLLATDGVAAAATGLVLALGDNPFIVLATANLLLLAVGLVLDIGAAILLLGPILLPVAIAAGIDPVAFGVLLVVNLMIGGLTPPVGILVQVVGATTGQPAAQIFGAMPPYLAALVGALLVMSVGVAAQAYFF